MDERLGADRDLVAEDASRLRARGRCSRCSAAARPSRRCRARPRRTPRPRTSTSRAGTTAAATPAAGRTRCPARARAWRRIHRGEGAVSKMGGSPDVSGPCAEHDPHTTDAAAAQSRSGERRTEGGSMTADQQRLGPDQGGTDRGPDRPALVRRARERQRRAHGHRRHQRQGWPAGPDARAPSSRTARRTTITVAAAAAARRGGGRRHLRRHLQLQQYGTCLGMYRIAGAEMPPNRTWTWSCSTSLAAAAAATASSVAPSSRYSSRPPTQPARPWH